MLFFASNRVFGEGCHIYVSTRTSRVGELGAPSEVANVNSATVTDNDIDPFVTADGQELWFARSKELGNHSIYRAVWDGSSFANVAAITAPNSGADDLLPTLSADKRTRTRYHAGVFAWLVIREDNTDVLAAAIAKAWSGGDAVIARLAFPARKAPRQIAVVWADRARAQRAARWPDLLDDWKDIYDEALFPNAELPVLAEELSGLGAPTLCAHAGPGLVAGTVAWYEQGALIGYEHVGGASVSWDPEAGLGRPFDGTAASIAALGGKRVAKLFGADRDVGVFDRALAANRAVGNVLLTRAFHRMLDQDPPAMDELAGLVAKAATVRVGC